ncbi:MAG: hypothetical protein COA58_07815 [Bacteroidetes bacterium]|nr:MAG: hypothetical protein COA58_07815 [Bacteroidota bacterium]
MKKHLTLLFLVALNLIASAQCLIEPWSLEKRINNSTVVIEGRVIGQQGVWDDNHNNIYTINTIEVYKSFKGSYSNDTIYVVTEGGRVGLEMLTVSPSLELQKGDVGILLLKTISVAISDYSNLYIPTASTQSYLNYDLNSVKVHDHIKTYVSMKFELYDEIAVLVGESYRDIKPFDAEAERKRIKALAPPVISSFSAATLTAGSSTEITINGSNFGIARGSGKVGFKDANFGDGRYYYSPTGWSYTAWSNSQIKLIVPSRAGTGKIQVINTTGESGESSSDLTVDWSHLNINYPLSSSDTPFFEIQHVEDNNSGGYTWQMTNNFAGKTSAVSSFLRSLEEWRCETQMNWVVGPNTTADTISSDNINIVRFTNFGDSRLGVCYSRYSGCFINGATDMNWYVTETDIQFDSTYDWYYGTGTPTSSQFDFESVATHELGHGHQLGHVRASAKVMHYSISNGQRKPDLVATDIACGVYIKNKSVASGVCGKSAMTAVPNGSCTISVPNSDFTIGNTNICPNTNVSITDETDGDVQSYSWNFGSGASPATANSVGPHTVSYSSSGTKTVRLIATNNVGSDTTERTLVVINDTLDTPSEFGGDTACKEVETYTINNIENADSYEWSVLSGGSITADLINSVKVNWQDTGLHTITVRAKNECADGPLRTVQVYVLSEPISQFSESVDGIEVSFINECQYGESYLWTFGDGQTSTEVSPVYKFIDKGDYTTTLKAINRCAENSSNKNLSLTYKVGINELGNAKNVYPNPIKIGDILKITGRTYSTYKLQNIEGQLIYAGDILNNSVRIDVLVPAVYILTLTNDGESVNYRLQVTE